MDKGSNKFVILFQTAVCVVLAILLAGAYNGLSDSIAANQRFDKQRNILKAVGLWDPATEADKPRKELEELFATRMRAEVLEIERGEVEVQVKRAGVVSTEKVEKVLDVVKTDHAITELDDLLRDESKKPVAERREFAPFYVRVDEQGEPEAVCIPISGYGLWSTLYGFLALGEDARDVVGITFYDHKETPGLGGEVDNPSWQAQWVGKSVRDASGSLIGINVKKGGAAPDDPHAVDGLSGATITGDGVQRFVLHDLETYEPYFQKFQQR